jgi:pyrimidine operon attenuation protein/uracil phosphoribosyltransferase
MRSLNPEAIVGLPTLGLSIAPQVAGRLGQRNFVALAILGSLVYGSAIGRSHLDNSPEHNRRLYVDPNLISRLTRRPMVLVDDVVARDTTSSAALQPLARVPDVVGASTAVA